jgi:exopolysaccharide biosynthesis polyprenyl glycosylphosphotransferase
VFFTFLTDIATITLAFFGSYIFQGGLQSVNIADIPRIYIVLWVGATVLFVFCFIVQGGYRGIHRISFQKQLEIVIRSIFYNIIIIMALLFATKNHSYSRLFLGVFFIFLTSFIFIARICLNYMNKFFMERGFGVKRSAIIGTTHSAEKIFRRFSEAVGLGYEIVGFIEENGRGDDRAEKIPWIIGHIRNLDSVITRNNIDQIFLLDWSIKDFRYDWVINLCKKRNIGLKYVSERTDLLFRMTRIDDITGIPLVITSMGLIKRISNLLSRIVDYTGGIILAAMFLPFYVCIAILIKLDSKGRVLFRQERLTKNGKPFTLYKFRTMYENADRERDQLEKLNEVKDGPIFKIKNDPRITRVGRILRKFSLDEFPQLFNVVLGHMSLVGPRPPLGSEVDQYLNWHLRRLEVLQGLTGLWQISGRSELSFEEMVLLDIYYIENKALLFDLEILFATIPCVLLGSGAY